MTLSTQSTKAVAQGNGATTVFPYTFLIPSQADLVVTVVTLATGAETVIGTSLYTVTGIGNAAGGNVTYPLSGSPLSSAFKIVVQRIVPYTQETDLVNQGAVYPADIEDEFDFLTMQTQQLNEQLARSMKFNLTDMSLPTLPPAAARANKYLSFDGSGDPTASALAAGSVTVSAAMIPVVGAASLAAAISVLDPAMATFLNAANLGAGRSTLGFYDTKVAATAATIAASINFVLVYGYTTYADGGGALYKRVVAQPTHAGKFQSVDGTWWEYFTALADSKGINVKAFAGAKGDGVTDDTVAIQAAVDYADGKEVYIPAGSYKVSQIVRLTSVTDTFRNGMKLIGDGRSSNLIANTSSKSVLLWDVGYTPTGSAVGTLKFTRFSEVRDILITQTGGLTAVNGITMTAAWNLKFENVSVEGMSGYGVGVPWRADIYAAVSDNWQCFSLDFQRCRFSENTLWGVYFNGGQSPGLWRMQYSIIANNAGGGVYTETGHFEFTDNLNTSNGTFGGNGGMLVNGTEGQAQVATIARNEFDTSHSYFLWLVNARECRVVGNRFLSFTFASNVSLVFQTGTAFMRPPIHVKLDNGTVGPGASITWNNLFEQNYHRSIYGAGPTVAAVQGYISAGGDQTLENRFINNDMRARDGVNQNSTGMIRYTNLLVGGTQGNSIVDANLVGLSALASAVTAVTGAATTITFGTEAYDTHGAFASPTFTTPHAGRYRIASTIQIIGLTLGNTVTLSIYVNGAAVQTNLFHAGGLASQSFAVTGDIFLAETDTVTIRALQNSGANHNTTADNGTRLSINQIS